MTKYLNPDVTKFSQGSRAAWLHQNGAMCKYKIPGPNLAKNKNYSLPFLQVFDTVYYVHTFHLNFLRFLHSQPHCLLTGLSLHACLPYLCLSKMRAGPSMAWPKVSSSRRWTWAGYSRSSKKHWTTFGKEEIVDNPWSWPAEDYLTSSRASF